MSYPHDPRSGPVHAPSGRPRRPVWHWAVLGGVGLIGLMIAALVAAVILWQILTRGDPRTTLEDFYDSLRDSDCEVFMDSTTEDYRDATGLVSCDVFEEATGQMSAVDHEVDDRINRQGYAIFEVTERYTLEGQDVEVQLRYYVRRVDGQWDLDGIEVVGGEDPAGSV